MSASYPLIDTGFYVDGEVAAYILLATDQTTGIVPGEITELLDDGSFVTAAKAGALPCDYTSVPDAHECIEDISCYASEFDGEVLTLFPERTASPIEEALGGDDYLVYVPAAKEAELFKAAYQSPEELLEEFKAVFARQGIAFPDDFDWWRHIVSISGTNFC